MSNNKIIILIILFALKVSWAKQDFYSEVEYDFKTSRPYSALIKVMNKFFRSTPDLNYQYLLEDIVQTTGPYYFNTFSDIDLRKTNIPSTDLIMAKRNLYLNKHHWARKRLKRIKKGHRLYPEALLIEAQSYQLEKKYEKARSTFKDCIYYAHRMRNRGNEINQYMYENIKEICHIGIARSFYDEKKYKDAIRWYEDFDLKSRRWPYTLVELAWSYFKIKDYNRSLGVLITFDSPLLKTYMKPEVNYLRALNYYNLCLYKKSLDEVEKFMSAYNEITNQLKTYITNKESKDSLYFYALATKEYKEENELIKGLVIQATKRTKFHVDMQALQKMYIEMMIGHLEPSVYSGLKSLKTNLMQQINHFVKVYVIGLINETVSMAPSMTELKLELLYQLRKLVRKQKDSNRKGDLSEVMRSSHQEYWELNQEFWADELGTYSFGLKTQCENQKG